MHENRTEDNQNNHLIYLESSIVNWQSLLMAAIIGVIMCGVTFYSFSTAVDKDWYWISILLILAGVVISALRIRYSALVEWALFIIIPPCMFVLLENFMHPFGEVMKNVIVLELIFYYAVFLILLFIAGRTAIASIGGTIIFGFIGLANYFVILFRGNPILPWDLYSIRVASSVASNYEYTLSARACNVLLFIVLIWALSLKMRIKIKVPRTRIVGAVLSVMVFLGMGKLVQLDKVVARAGISQMLWVPAVQYRDNGTVLGFIYSLKYLHVGKPEGYSQEKVKEIQEQVGDNEAVSVDLEKAPNVIVIMNEAFSDLSVLGDFETNQDVMPFIHSMSENTQKGWLHMSVKGGNTANSEFEFLTNETMRFMPVGSVPYQQYIHSYLPCLPYQFIAMGYRTISIHPFWPGGWNRTWAYDSMGFQEQYFISAFEDPEYVRGFISDKSSYDKILERYEHKQENERLFVFDVTIQNHGDYTGEQYDNFTPDIKVNNDSDADLSSTEEYLSLIKRSDEDFKELVEYFENQDEPTIIVMFGDHQPSLTVTSPIDTGKQQGDWGNDAVSDNFRKENYMVPYIIWANYDIDETKNEEMSANYLSLKLLDDAGLPLTGFQKYLRQLAEKVPVLTSMTINNLTDETEDELLNDYKILQYNLMFDEKNRDNSFYELHTPQNE